MASRMWKPAAVAGMGLAACGYVFAFDPSEPGHFPPCPTKVLTGLDCPFCGSLRATHELMHGNLVGALDLNAVTVLLVLPAMLVIFALWTYRTWRDEKFEMRFPVWATATAAVLLVAFTVVRNLPGMPLGSSA